MKLRFNLKKENFNIKKYLLFLKKNYKKLMAFVVLMIPTLFTISSYQSLRQTSHLEDFCSRISSNITDSTYKYQNLSIYSKDNTTTGVKDFFPTTTQYSIGDCFSTCTLVANQNITKDSVFISDGNNDVEASLVIPKTNWVINSKNTYRLEFMDLELYYERSSFPQIFCYISDVYADKLVQERQYSGYDELIGDGIKLKYLSNGTLKEQECKISSIYKTNTAGGSYYYNLYGEFVITSLSYLSAIDNLALSFDLNKSIYNNSRVIHILEENFSTDEYHWDFVDNELKSPSNKKQFDLNQEYSSYHDTNYDSFKKTRIIIMVVAVVLVISLFGYLLWMNHSFDRNYDAEEYRVYTRLFVFFNLLLFAILYFILKLAKLSLYTTSTSILLWIILVLYLSIIVNIPRLARKKRTKNV